MKTIVAIDQSLTSTGICAAKADASFFAPFYATETITPKKLTGVPRLLYIRSCILLVTANADIVIMEGYAYNAQGRNFEKGELGGVIKVALHELNKKLIIVSPTQLKQWATGKGNAGKPEMMMAAERSKLFGKVSTNDDEIDALWLAHIGVHLATDEPATNEARRGILAALGAQLVSTTGVEPKTAKGRR